MTNNNNSLNAYKDILSSSVDNTCRTKTVNTTKQLYNHRSKVKINNRTKKNTIVRENINKLDNNERTNSHHTRTRNILTKIHMISPLLKHKLYTYLHDLTQIHIYGSWSESTIKKKTPNRKSTTIYNRIIQDKKM